MEGGLGHMKNMEGALFHARHHARHWGAIAGNSVLATRSWSPARGPCCKKKGQGGSERA